MFRQKNKLPSLLLCISFAGVVILVILFAASNRILLLLGEDQELTGRFLKSITLFIVGTSFAFSIPYMVEFFIKRLKQVLQAGGSSGALTTFISNAKYISHIMTSAYITLTIIFFLFAWFAYSVWNGDV